MNKIFKKNISVYVITGADPGFGNGGGGKISSEASLKHIHQLGVRGGGGGSQHPPNKI